MNSYFKKQPTLVEVYVKRQLMWKTIVGNLWEADCLWAKWCKLRYERKKPMGSAVFELAVLKNDRAVTN